MTEMATQDPASEKGTKRRIRVESTVCEMELSLDPPRIITLFGITKERRVRRYDLKITSNQKVALL